MREAAQQASQYIVEDAETAWRDFARTAAASRKGALMSVLSPMRADLENDTELVKARAERRWSALPAVPEEHATTFIERALLDLVGQPQLVTSVWSPAGCQTAIAVIMGQCVLDRR
jgi:hypothetical protein